MNALRKVEVFTAGCPACEEAVELVKGLACSSCDVEALDMRQKAVAQRAKGYGISHIPAVAIDGRLADCCQGGKLTAAALQTAGIGHSR